MCIAKADDYNLDNCLSSFIYLRQVAQAIRCPEFTVEDAKTNAENGLRVLRANMVKADALLGRKKLCECLERWAQQRGLVDCSTSLWTREREAYFVAQIKRGNVLPLKATRSYDSLFKAAGGDYLKKADRREALTGYLKQCWRATEAK